MVFGSSNKCLDALREAKKRLKEEGVKSILDEDEQKLVVPAQAGDLELIYNAVCIDKKRIRVISVIREVEKKLGELDEKKRLELLRKLLLVPASLKVSVAIDHDGDLIFEPWVSSLGEASWEEVEHSLSLFALFAKWLDNQLKNAREGKPLEDFELKKQS